MGNGGRVGRIDGFDGQGTQKGLNPAHNPSSFPGGSEGDGHPRKKHLFFVSWTGVLKIQPENPESWALQKTPLGTSFIPPHILLLLSFLQQILGELLLYARHLI